MNGAIRASTLSQELWPALVPLLARSDVWQSVPVGNEDYIAKTRALPMGLSAQANAAGAAADPPSAGTGASVIILRSRTERLGFLNPLHGRLGIIAVVAVLAATLLSYAIARTVTRPLGAIIGDDARDGDDRGPDTADWRRPGWRRPGRMKTPGCSRPPSTR